MNENGFVDHGYFSAILVLNSYGKLIQKYSDKDTSVRSVVTGVYSGDYVMDNKNAIYQRVITNKYTRHSRAISDSDLETMISEEGVETFYFTESDFGFINPNDLISVLPLEITEKYESEGIEKLNNILEDKTLLYTIDALQGSVIPADYKSEVFEQFASLNTEEIVQINRCFLEENYSTICPQRVTVSKAIIEILPLASVVLSESDLYECPIDYDEIGDAQREASASWREANSKKEYEQMLAEMEGKLKRYKILLIDEKLNFPVTTQETEKDKFKLNSSVGITNSRLVLGITGSFDLTWTNAYSSVEVVAFFKSQAGIDVSFSRKDKEIKKISDNLQYTSDPNEKSERGEFGKIYNPITKKSLPIIDWEKSHTMNLISYPVGPVVFGINLIFKFGLPVELNFELNTNITYDAYIAGMASAGVSASLNFEFKTYKKWIFTLLKINVDGSGDKWAYADAIYYVDFSGNSLSANFNQLSVNFTVRPFMKCDLDASISGMLHAGLKFKEELSGYIKFGYYKPKVYGSFGLNNNTEFALYTFIGVKNVKFLGKNLGDVGKTWEWPPIRESIPLIKETIFFEKEF